MKSKLHADTAELTIHINSKQIVW